jgi:hypothetical protein
VAPRDEAYERARSKVLARLGFYRHVATYAVAIAALILIDAVTGGGVGDVSRWIAAIWGAILLLHGFNVFIVPNVWSRETEERMIEEEMLSAAQELQFEKAARLRDQLAALREQAFGAAGTDNVVAIAEAPKAAKPGR